MICQNAAKEAVQFSSIAVTNYYKIDGLKQQKFSLSQFERPRSLVKSECQQSCCLPPKAQERLLPCFFNFSWLHAFLGFCLHDSILCFHVHMVFFLSYRHCHWVLSLHLDNPKLAVLFKMQTVISVFCVSVFSVQFTASIYLELQNYINSTVLRRGKKLDSKKIFSMYPVKLLSLCHGFSVV